jgi:aminoglycoside phosphotransferase (APT) family kinase protein
MRREARILAALAPADVAHPRFVDACSDESVFGAAFYVMAAVNGVNPTVAPPRWVQDLALRRTFAFVVVEEAAKVAALDHVAIGLDGLGRPDGFLSRQVERWKQLHESYESVSAYDISKRQAEITTG